MKTTGCFREKMPVAVCAVMLLTGGLARAAVVPPLYVGNVEPVVDEYGRRMAGSALPSGEESRSLVEIRTTTDGIVRPPTTNGVPHPYNPLLTPSSTGGMGMNASGTNSGIFCMVFHDRPGQGTKLFARAYNAPTREEASFYADTALAEAPGTDSSLVVTFRTATPLDDGDDDGDGLNNSWEKSLGTDDRPAFDYDADGMGDLYEMWAGTDPTDPDSNLAIRDIHSEGTGPAPQGEGGEGVQSVRLRWQSAPGRRYQIQYVPSLLGDPVFVPVGDIVTAGDGDSELEVVVDIPEEATTGTFRVQLVRD